MHLRIALAIPWLVFAFCCEPQRVCAEQTQQRFDPRDLTGVWMQTPDRPFNTYPLTPEYEAILKQRRADEAAGKPFQVAQNRCLPAGLAATMTTGAYPIEIFYQKCGQEMLFEKGKGG